ncbi:MAG: zinc ribbon domain-containing protein [Oscillospiraceae bacterium]|nr:zinc ribbon domain-containing protein [Oscillospiraceae bacterium]
MFCSKCGNQMPDGAKFCSACGAVNEAAQAPEAPAAPQQQAAPQQHIPAQPQQPHHVHTAPKASSNTKVGMIAAGILAVIVVVLAVIIFGGRGPKATVNQFLKGTFNGNANQIVKLMPKKQVKAIIEEEYHGDKKDMVEDLDDMLDEMLDMLSEADIKTKFKITDIDKLDRDDTEDCEEELNSQFDTNIKVKKAKVITAEITFRSKEFDEKYENEIELTVGKIGSSWYILDADFEEIFY